MLILGLLLAFAGSEKCAPCHPAIYGSQSGTAHSRSLARTPSDSPVRSDWAFGAGSQAVTYVSRMNDEYYLEHPLSFYKATGKLAPTPGHNTAAGEKYKTFAPDSAILRCFQCHSSGPLRLQAGNRIEPYEPGVRCEACHGPGSEHAAKPAGNNLVHPGRLSAAELNDLCGQCHRMPPAAGSATNWSNPWNVRHQPVYFSQSRCFLESAGKLSCITCHSPHKDQVRESCGSCHAQVRHLSPISGQSCSACHMPKVNPQPALSFTNHWIGVYGVSRLKPRR